MKRISVNMLILALMAIFACPAVSQQDAFLVGYWAFEEGNGDTVEDISGNGNDGVINGEVNWVEGMIGTALEFTPGANVEIPDSDSLRDMAEYTVGMWVKINEFAPEWNHLFEKDGSYGITINTGGGDFRYTPNSSKVWIESKHQVDNDTWYYITMKWDGSNISFYVDGDEVNQADEPAVFNTNAVNIAHAAPYTVDGVFDEVKIWAKALTTEEISVAMKGELAVKASREKLTTTWAGVRSGDRE
jgi:hypothetical protein